MRRRNPFPGVSRAPDRHGKRRWRFRRRVNGRMIDCYLHGDYGSAQFVSEYEKACVGIRPDGATKFDRIKPGTFHWLIHSYRQSPKYRDLSAVSKLNKDAEIAWLQGEVGDLPFNRFQLKHVEALMGKKSGPSAANKVKKLLSLLFNHAIRLELLTVNPARLATRFKENPDGYHTATDHEIEQFRECHHSGSKARLALELILNTGAARQDLCGLGWQNIKAGRFDYKRGKTWEGTTLPILPELKAEIDQLPKDALLFLTHGKGRRYQPATLANWFKDQCKLAKLDHWHLHCLRKAGATRLANAGATENEIAAYLAHSNTKQASTYTKKADKSRLTDSGFAKLRSANQERNVSNLSNRLDNIDSKPLRGKEK